MAARSQHVNHELYGRVEKPPPRIGRCTQLKNWKTPVPPWYLPPSQTGAQRASKAGDPLDHMDDIGTRPLTSRPISSMGSADVQPAPLGITTKQSDVPVIQSDTSKRWISKGQLGMREHGKNKKWPGMRDFDVIPLTRHTYMPYPTGNKVLNETGPLDPIEYSATMNLNNYDMSAFTKPYTPHGTLTVAESPDLKKGDWNVEPVNDEATDNVALALVANKNRDNARLRTYAMSH